jgi:hypothetical protein
VLIFFSVMGFIGFRTYRSYRPKSNPGKLEGNVTAVDAKAEAG